MLTYVDMEKLSSSRLPHFCRYSPRAIINYCTSKRSLAYLLPASYMISRVIFDRVIFLMQRVEEENLRIRIKLPTIGAVSGL